MKKEKCMGCGGKIEAHRTRSNFCEECFKDLLREKVDE